MLNNGATKKAHQIICAIDKTINIAKSPEVKLSFEERKELLYAMCKNYIVELTDSRSYRDEVRTLREDHFELTGKPVERHIVLFSTYKRVIEKIETEPSLKDFFNKYLDLNGGNIIKIPHVDGRICMFINTLSRKNQSLHQRQSGEMGYVSVQRKGTMKAIMEEVYNGKVDGIEGDVDLDRMEIESVEQIHSRNLSISA